jgi:hypothetical protein
MKNYLISAIILSFGIIISYTLVAQALTEVDIVYPVAELGNCKNEKECRSYCDKQENMDACLNFAEKYNLISDEELEMAKKFAKVGKGPGGCTSKDSCEAYCDDISHMDECLVFAERHGIIPPEELKEAKQVQAALKKGLKQPGNCRNKKECDVYCNEPAHMEECIAFADAAGFLPPEDREDAQKVLAAIKQGAKPPPCRGKKECDSYCSKPENMKQCMEFAIAAGFMKPEEMKEAQKVLDAIKKGVNPPPCRSKEECDIWCAESDENMTVCTKFAAAAGFMSEKDAEMALKTGGKGPGGCRGKDQCEKFCQDPANEEICFNFAKEHGMIPEEDLKNMEQGKKQMMQVLEQAPPKIAECLKETVGVEVLEKLKAGTFMPSRELGEKMRECGEKMMEKMGPPQGMMPSKEEMIAPSEGMTMPEGMTGPGGCQSPEECEKYCKEHQEECMKFGAPAGAPTREERKPGMFEKIKDFRNRVINGFKPNGEDKRIPSEIIQPTIPQRPKMPSMEGLQEQIKQLKQRAVEDGIPPEEAEKMMKQLEQQMMPPSSRMPLRPGQTPPPGGQPGFGYPPPSMPTDMQKPPIEGEGMMAPPGAPIPGTGISPENLPPMEPTVPQMPPPPPPEQTAPPQNLQGFLLQTLSGMFRLLLTPH